MPAAHPKLSLRPQLRPGLQRPTLRHPVLGTLEYINRGGGWWQGTATIAGLPARLDLQQDSNPTEYALLSAAGLLQWLQQNELACRTFVGKQLAEGEYELNTRRRQEPPRLDNPAFVSALRPAKVVLWPDHADLQYDCTALPGGGLEGAHRIEVMIDDSKSPQLVTLLELDLTQRIEDLFQQPLPADAADFENSLADQLLARAAEGRLRLDSELKGLLDQAIEDIQKRIPKSSPVAAAYLTTAKALLSELARTALTVIERIFVRVNARHPAGKRMPFKQKLVFAPTDRARFDGSGTFPSIQLFDVDIEDEGSPEAFAAALHARLEEAAGWLARQSPAVFQELRAAGFLTEASLHVVARFTTDSVNFSLPPLLLEACGRLGFSVSLAISNSVSW